MGAGSFAGDGYGTLCTGDKERTAKAVAKGLETDEIRAEALRRDKHDFVNAFKRPGARVAVAGDGINDAPALAAADPAFRWRRACLIRSSASCSVP